MLFVWYFSPFILLGLCCAPLLLLAACVTRHNQDDKAKQEQVRPSFFSGFNFWTKLPRLHFRPICTLGSMTPSPHEIHVEPPPGHKLTPISGHAMPTGHILQSGHQLDTTVVLYRSLLNKKIWMTPWLKLLFDLNCTFTWSFYKFLIEWPCEHGRLV